MALVTFEWLEWMWIIGASREVDHLWRAVRHHLVIQFMFASSTQFACINNELKATTLRHRHQCAVKVRNFHVCILSIHDTLHSRRCRHHRLYVIRQTIKFSANIGAQFTANWFLTSRFPSHHIFKLLQMNVSEYWGENLNYTQEMHTEMHTFLLFFLSLPLFCVVVTGDFENWKLCIWILATSRWRRRHWLWMRRKRRRRRRHTYQTQWKCFVNFLNLYTFQLNTAKLQCWLQEQFMCEKLLRNSFHLTLLHHTAKCKIRYCT